MTETAWCPECRTRQPVEETTSEGHQTRRGEVEYGVTHLACDHSVQGPERVIAPAPGEPYAGPQTMTAASASIRDRVATEAIARRELERHADTDPWLP